MAPHFTVSRVDQALAAVRRWSMADLDAATFLCRAAHALYRVVPYDRYAAATIDPASNLITHAFAGAAGADNPHRSVNPDWFEHFYFAETLDQTLMLVGQRRWAATIGDVTAGGLDHSLCYREAMRPAGVADKLHAVFVNRGLWGDLELYRDNGGSRFSPEEVAIVHRLAPDIANGLRHAALRAPALGVAAADDAPGVLLIDRRGRVTATAAGQRLLAGLGGRPPAWPEARALPVPVQVVLGALDQALATSSADGGSPAPRLRVRSADGRWLTLHAALSEATETTAADRVVVITPSRPREVAWLGMAAYDLTPREEEIVKLVVIGQSTKQIADRLFIAEPTVQRHLTNIFAKVGVRGRRALVKHLFVEQVLPGMA